MKRLIAFALLTGALAGCQGASDGHPMGLAEANSQTAGGLTATIQMPTRFYSVGDAFSVVVTIVNSSQQAQLIGPSTGAAVYVKVMRWVPQGWVEVKRYSSAASKPWTLSPGSSRSFPIPLHVESDWPTDEPLRITAEINGRPDLAPGIVVQVQTR